MTNSNIAAVIDAYATLCNEIASLEKDKAALKKELDFLDAGSHEGNLFVLTVSETERETLDMKAVREKLTPQFMRAHTTVTPVRMFRTKARTAVEEV